MFNWLISLLFNNVLLLQNGKLMYFEKPKEIQQSPNLKGFWESIFKEANKPLPQRREFEIVFTPDNWDQISPTDMENMKAKAPKIAKKILADPAIKNYSIVVSTKSLIVMVEYN